jgi:Killer toxin-resistance protein 1
MIDGTVQLIQVVYTQLFTLPLEQWPTYQPGTIGLGTIQGSVGVVKTKRDVTVETQIPVAVLSDESMRLSAEVELEAELEVAPGHGSQTEAEATHEKPASDEGSNSDGTSRKILENKTGKVVDLSAGSALALILAIAAMVVA